MKSLYSFIKRNLTYRSEESEYQYSFYAIFTFIGFIGFYFFNPKILATEQYENIYIRLIAALLSFLLLIRSYWPKFCKKYLKVYWYVTLTFNLPFFFTFMLLQNKWAPEWQLNELMALTILAILTDLTALLFLAPLGILLACVFYYLANGIFILPINIAAIMTSYLTILIFCSIFSYKKDKFYLERLKFYDHVNELNEQLESKISERTYALEKALAVKTEFLNNMSHELRTPLQGFMGISEGLYLNWYMYDDAQKHLYMHEIVKNSQRLTALVENLLDLAMFNEGKFILHLHKVKLNKIIEDIIDEAKSLYLNNKAIKIVFEPLASKSTVMGDSNRLIQVLRNLFINAIKFSSDNSVITVKLMAEKLIYDDGSAVPGVHFAITDQGIGIPENELKTIFNSFEQSSRTKTNAGGTGLGLAICKKIISAHHGKIWAENNMAQKGSIFHFIIPITQKTIVNGRN